MEGKTVERLEAIKVALSFAKTEREAFKLANKILNFIHQVNEVPEPNSKLVAATNKEKKVDRKYKVNAGRKRNGRAYGSYTSGESWLSTELLEAVKMRDEGKSITEIAEKFNRPYSETYPLIRSYDDKYMHLMIRISTMKKVAPKTPNQLANHPVD